MKFRRHKKTEAFTVIEILIAVGIIGILIAIAVPGFIRSRHSTRTKAIQYDLVKIDEASRMYVIENKLGPSDVMPTLQELIDDGYIRAEPKPPVQGVYYAAEDFTEVTTTNPGSYPRFEPASGNVVPEWRHPDLIAADP